MPADPPTRVFDGASVLVAGAGVSGLAAARVLLAEGASVSVTDDDPARLNDLPDGANASAGPIPAGAETDRHRRRDGARTTRSWPRPPPAASR